MLILAYEVVNVGAVGLGESRALDEQDVFGVELSAAGEVVGTGDDRIVNDEHFIVHESVWGVWAVWRRVLANQAGVGDDVLDSSNLPTVMAHVAPLLKHSLHLGTVIDARNLDSGATTAQHIAEGREEGAGVEEHTADTDAATRLSDALGDIEVNGRTAPGRKEHLDSG